jgi:hypothetical protein
LVGKLADRTHGRWPWLAAVAAAPVTAAYVANLERLREDAAWAMWAPLPVYLWHQTEEWVWPGGFLPWFNRDVLASGEDEFPITRRDGLVINAGLGWALAVAGGARGLRTPELGATVLGMLVGNAVLHLVETARAGRYTPGAATAVALLGPVGVAGLAAVARHPRGGPRAASVGALLGLGSGVVMLTAMRRRVAARARVA